MGIKFPDSVVFADIETHSLDERYAMPPQEYFRLGGWSWGESDEVHTTTSYKKMLEILESARVVVFHNGHNFDLSVLYGPDSVVPLIWARSKRVFDTFTHATLVMPAPEKYVNKEGREVLADSPDKARKWFSLDNLAHQLGVPGKSMDLKTLADKYYYREEPVYSEKTGKLLKRTQKTPLDVCCGYGAIPTDDETFVDYLKHDVLALRHVARKLLERGPLDDYAWRQQYDAGTDAQLSRNGIRVNTPLVKARMYGQDWTTAHVLNQLHDTYGFPLDGKKPLATKAGREALAWALKSVGVKEEDLGLTATGAPSYGGDSVLEAAKKAGTPEALELAEAVATLAGTRTLPELVHQSTHPDGKVHPDYMSLQRSGRKSITKPGLTVFDQNHKDYFLADSEDSLLVEFDYSNADARAVAAFSGDREFAKRFEPGQDGHMINAYAAWGKELVDTDPSFYRQRAKAPGHGWAYRIGKNKLAKTTGLPVSEAKQFLDNMNKTFSKVVRWQEACSAYARRTGHVVGINGRRMPVEPDRVYNQPPALLGQNFTTEVVKDALASMSIEYILMVRLTIHDAILFDIPKKNFDKHIRYIKEHLFKSYHPKGGIPMDFPADVHGRPEKNWKLATDKEEVYLEYLRRV